MFSILGQLFCATVAFLAIFCAPIAIWLGQIYQLNVLGFTLSVMNLVFAGRAFGTAVIFAGAQSSTTIQDLDALITAKLHGETDAMACAALDIGGYFSAAGVISGI